MRSKPAKRGDYFMVVGCLYRATSAIVQLLFAINERYFISDKGALAVCEGFAIKPDNLTDRVVQILTQPGTTTAELTQSVQALQALLGEIVD